MSSSGMGRDVHSLMLSIQHFLCQPRHRPPSKVQGGEAVVAYGMPEPCEFRLSNHTIWYTLVLWVVAQERGTKDLDLGND